MEPPLNWIAVHADWLQGAPLGGLNAESGALVRLHHRHYDQLPARVLEEARYPAGLKFHLQTDSPRLVLRGRSLSPPGDDGVDVMVDGRHCATWTVDSAHSTEFEVSTEGPARGCEIELHCPCRQQIVLEHIGVPAGYSLTPVLPSRGRLLVYGSSIAQGCSSEYSSGAAYVLLARELGLELVNLGFYGAGRAEPAVVELVASVTAELVILDLGKSYGRQDGAAYVAMLDTLSRHQPDTPVVSVTPVYSSRERTEPDFLELSRQVRDTIRMASTGVRGCTLIEGTDLLGESDEAGLSADRLHPNALGFQRIADRLLPLLPSCRST